MKPHTAPGCVTMKLAFCFPNKQGIHEVC